MNITRYLVSPVIWAIAYQQIIGSLTTIAVYADSVIFMKLSIFAFLKSEWTFQCYMYHIFPIFSSKKHRLIHHYLGAAGPQK